MGHSRSKLVRSRLLVMPLLAVAVAAGCDSDPTDPILPDGIAIVSGHPQTIATGESSDPLIVLVSDQDGFPLPGANVTWAVTEGDGSLSTTATISDTDGRAEVTFTAGETAGSVTVTATAQGLDPVTFSVTVTTPEE